MEEFELSGGNASGHVVRVGRTVRKPWVENSAVVQEYLSHLHSRGVDVPRPLGRDESGRQSVEYVEGTMALAHMPLRAAELRRVGRIVRQIHDASETVPLRGGSESTVLIPTADPNLMCHNDLAPWNLVIGDRWVFIDWDGAGPSTRLWDLAYAAQAFAMLIDGEPVDGAAARLRSFVDGYGADTTLRQALPSAMAQRTTAMFELLRSSHDSSRQPWAEMYTTGHGELWRSASAYVIRNQTAWEQAL